MQLRVSRPDVLDVALEVLHVHRVEADERHVQPDVYLGELVAEPIGTLALNGRELRLSAVEGLEEASDRALVGLERSGEARLVDAVVDLVVDPGVSLLNLALELCGVQYNVTVLLLDYVIKLAVQISYTAPTGPPDFRGGGLTSVPNMRRISLLSLLTILLVCLS